MARIGNADRGIERKYQVQHLWERHHQVLRMAVLGIPDSEIAAATGYTKQMISNIKNSEIGRDQLRVMRGAIDQATVNVAAHISELQESAVCVLEKLMTSESENIRARVAMDLLDRGGHPAQKNVNLTHTHTISASDIEEIKRRAEASGLLAPSEARSLSSTSEVPTVPLPTTVEQILEGEIVS